MEEKEITIPEIITVRDLAELLGETPIKIIKILMTNGVLASINQQIDFDTAAVIASEFGFEAKQPYAELEEDAQTELSAWQILLSTEAPEDLCSRPPVVTVLGHVDHGKTSLLDAIRHTNVQGKESGGITQHIGAYQIKHNGRRITFLDTPGHEAFTAMRARGANTTDIAVLVVAADDGVQPQTIEAINHARAAHVPIIVALNKVDKPNAQPEVVKRQLADQGLMPDEWGGTTMVIPVSARKQSGLEDLLEAILLVADEACVQANPDREAVGTILEGRLDKRQGPLATVLIQNGTLHTGDIVVVGKTWGKIRALEDENDKRHRTAPPATPTVIVGLHDVPDAGDRLEAVKDERTARAIAQKRQEEARTKDLARVVRPLSLDDISNRIREGQVKELNIVLKTDVQGSIEPIVNSLERLSNDEVKVRVIHAAAGNISESDVMLASADQVAIDAVSAKLMGFDPMSIKYINLGHNQGLGIGNPREIELVGDDISGENWHFKVGHNLHQFMGWLTWYGPTKFLQKLVTRTPLVIIPIAFSEVYHDYVHWPLKEKHMFEEWCESTGWGKLFLRYKQEGTIQ